MSGGFHKINGQQIQSKDEAFGSTIKTLAVQQQTTHDVLQADAHRSLPCPPCEKGMMSGSLEERQWPLAPLCMPSVLWVELHPSFLRLAKHCQTKRQKVESSQFIMYKQLNPIKNALKNVNKLHILLLELSCSYDLYVLRTVSLIQLLCNKSAL